NGISSFSPALPRQRLRRVIIQNYFYPNGVSSVLAGALMQPVPGRKICGTQTQGSAVGPSGTDRATLG
ncbi:MAG TPA: hypothetical protein VFC17_05280, partial [Candidatus Limnocylindrales bacterium]|nr:hypothetical protein [Candidatus Limnocylindrales bacterium]